jgi:hypothetical protein
VAKEPSSSIGGVLGSILGLVVVAGLVGTPAYLAYLETDERALEIGLQDPVETIRRAVLNLDEKVGAMSDVYDALGQSVEPAAMREQLARNAALLKQAEAARRGLSEVRRGTVVGSSHLWARRIGAILFLAKGKLYSNRAELEEQMARALRDTAEERAVTVAALKRSAALVEARKPTEAIANLEKRNAGLEAMLATQGELMASLERLVSDKRTRVQELERRSREARLKLAELDGQGLSHGAHRSTYVRHSDAARAAEAEAAALANGSLKGAELVLDNGEDLLEAVYEGGTVEPGIRDLQFKLDALRERAAALEEAKTAAAAQQAKLQGVLADLASGRSEVLAKVRTLAAELDDLLARADGHGGKADEARRQALDAFEQAAGDARRAVNAAVTRTRKAASEVREAGDVADERLKRISNDTDTEGALQSLAAEIAYNAALVHLCQINALQAAHDTEAFLAKMLAREGPADIGERLTTHRQAAGEELVRSQAAFENARSKIKSTNLRASDGTTVSGRNILWQIDVGLAAVRLLQGNLAERPGERAEAQEMAYDLLVEAARDRERSPLLTPAVETIRYLQRVAENP